jgi:hypothetical protein
MGEMGKSFIRLKMRQAYKKYKNLFSTKEFNKKKLVHSVE